MYHLALSLYSHFTSREEYSLLLLGLDNAGKTTLLSAIKSLYPSIGGSQTKNADGSTNLPPITQSTIPTVGQTVTTIDLEDMYLKIWDVGGQVSLRRLWKSYYKTAHAIVFIVDSTDLGDIDDDAQKATKEDIPEDDADEEAWESISPRNAKAPELNADHIDAIQGEGSGTKEDVGRLGECRLVLESILSSADTAGVPVLVLANKQDREDCLETVKIKEGLVRPVFEGEKGASVRDSRVLPVSALKGTGVKEAVEWVRSRVKWNKTARPPLMR